MKIGLGWLLHTTSDDSITVVIYIYAFLLCACGMELSFTSQRMQRITSRSRGHVKRMLLRSCTVASALAAVPSAAVSAVVRGEGRGGGVGVVDGHAVERVPVRVRERVRGAEVGVGAGSGRADRLAKAVVRAAGCAGVRPRVVALRVRVGVVDGHRLCARAVGDARRPH